MTRLRASITIIYTFAGLSAFCSFLVLKSYSSATLAIVTGKI